MSARRAVALQAGAARRQSRYAVIRVGPEWRLLFDGDLLGRFTSREAATQVAEKLCAASAALGVSVDLTVQTETGELRRELSSTEQATGAALARTLREGWRERPAVVSD
jgi:hypothetical protein